MKYSSAAVVLILCLAIQLIIIKYGWFDAYARLTEKEQIFCGTAIEMQPYSTYMFDGHVRTNEDERVIIMLFDDIDMNRQSIKVTANTYKTTQARDRICFKLYKSEYTNLLHNSVINRTAGGIIIIEILLLTLGFIIFLAYGFIRLIGLLFR